MAKNKIEIIEIGRMSNSEMELFYGGADNSGCTTPGVLKEVCGNKQITECRILFECTPHTLYCSSGTYDQCGPNTFSCPGYTLPCHIKVSPAF